MSTNYYAQLNYCSCCDRADEVHIGQWAARRFLLARHKANEDRPSLMNLDEWIAWLEEENIPVKDEYDKWVSLDELVATANLTVRTPESDHYHEWQGPTYVSKVGQEFF